MSLVYQTGKIEVHSSSLHRAQPINLLKGEERREEASSFNIINNIINKLFVDNNEIYNDDEEFNNLIKNIKKVQSTIDILFTFDEEILETVNKFAKNINLNQNNNVDVVSLYKKFIKNINNKNIDMINEKLLSIKNKEMYNSESEYKYLKWLVT